MGAPQTSAAPKRPENGQVPVTCCGCGALTWKWPNRVRQAARLFCSVQCQRSHRAGDLNPNWRGGEAERSCVYCARQFTAFQANARKGHALYCSQPCKSEGQRIWPDLKTAARVHRRRTECRARAGRSDLNHHSEEEWEALLSKRGGRCAHSGSTERIERDHIIPLSKGGDDAISNIQPLCVTCNRRKWNKMP